MILRNHILPIVVAVIVPTSVALPQELQSEQGFTNRIGLTFGEPIANTNAWSGMVSFELGCSRLLDNNMTIGGAWSGSLLFPVQPTGFSFETIQANALVGLVGYNVQLSKRLSLQPRLGVGYAWMQYERNEFTIEFSAFKFFKKTSSDDHTDSAASSNRSPSRIDDDGVLVEPGVRLSLQMGRRWSLNLAGSYQIIFGDEEIPGSDGPVRLLRIGLGLGFAW